MKIKLECDNQALNNEYDFIYYSKKDYDLLKDKTNTIEFKNL